MIVTFEFVVSTSCAKIIDHVDTVSDYQYQLQQLGENIDYALFKMCVSIRKTISPTGESVALC